MKKILLVLGLAPLAVFGQQMETNHISKERDVAVPHNELLQQEIVTSPVKTHNTNNNTIKPQRRMGKAYFLNAEQVGVSFYDLMSNNSMPRRVLLYPDGKVSVAWTHSANQNQDFLDRGTAYNHFDGNSWVGQSNRDPNDPSKFEPQRAGWPNLLSVTENSVQKEMIISHYASGGTGVSGGNFLMKNSAIGNANFTTFDTLGPFPNGPLWPRAAVTGEKVHVIAVWNDYVVRNGVRNPVVYSRYDVNTKNWDEVNIMLPGYDNTRYRSSAADEYSIDARGDVVAVLISGGTNDLALFKSTDKGQNWTKTIIDSFPHAPWNPRDDTFFDTTMSNDGSGTVTIDNNGVAHVFWPRMRVFNHELSDTTFHGLLGSDGIMYWNDNHKSKQLVGGRINYDDDIDILDGSIQISYGGHGGSISSYPVATVDKNNNLFMIYSAPNELTITLDEEANFRDLYIIYSTNGGLTWSENIQAITQDMDKEDVFPSVARDADDDIHLLWMQDDVPGIFLVNNNEVVLNRLMYAAIPVQDVLQEKLGLPRVSINELSANNIYEIGEVFPNPSNGLVNVPVTMKRSSAVSVKMVDMLGKTVTQENLSLLPAGKSNLTLDVANLPSGVYFCEISSEGVSTTKKIVVK